MTSSHSVRFSAVVVSKGWLAVSLPQKTSLVLRNMPDKLITAETINSE